MLRSFVSTLVGLVVLGMVTQGGSVSAAENANRFAYLDEPLNPYYVSGSFPKLTTPQWTGDPKLKAIVVLAIDDMRDSAKYENYLRPILDRLKEIDGRAPVSIMTNSIEPTDAQVQAWLKEGLSIEVHTFDHPCPLLADGDFTKAKGTYDRCVDLLNEIENSRPVAFRMPCCDSLNTPSPRFWTEIFNQQTSHNHFLEIDSSVFNITNQLDSDLPSQLTMDSDGRPAFQKYLPFPSFVNTIQNYPYPYIIGGTCWEFPCVVPSDWEAQNLHQPNNPQTVEDLKKALDVTVRKEGVFDLVFHPHGWIRNDQVAELVDYADKKYGSSVKFLTFAECLRLLNQHLLDGQSLRNEAGQPNLVKLVDLNQDGYLDVMVQFDDHTKLKTRIWQPNDHQWSESTISAPAVQIRLGMVNDQIVAGVEDQNHQLTWWRWQDHQWTAWTDVSNFTNVADWILRDLNADGHSDVVVSVDGMSACYFWDTDQSKWTSRSNRLLDLPLAAAAKPYSPIRFVDLNADGVDECVYSSPTKLGVYRFDAHQQRWTQVFALDRSDIPASQKILPPFMRADGSNNGVWFHSNHVWYQNEDTNRLADLVDRIPFASLLTAPELKDERESTPFAGPKSPEEALASMVVPAGLKVELVACEPLLEDPVALDWSADGKLWVAEMRDYPNGMDGQGKPGGRIRYLEDTDGDGNYDRSTLFLDNVGFPSGVKAWRNGVLVTAAPDLFYAEDTNGDGQADKREVLFQGFREGNQQHRINGLHWGVDGWIYLANGDSGGTIRSVKTGQELNLSGHDVRIRPDSGQMELVSGQTQYGRASDSWGNWFGGNNSSPVWHYVLEDRYLKRNPFLAVPSVHREISNQPGAAPIFPASPLQPRFNDFDRANRFTSACSPMVYRDVLLHAPEESFVYVCEPVHNMVHREIMTQQGVSFRSERSATEQQSEFFASTDNWSRPVMVRTGPDGAVWVCDMYRLVIEHPEWIPEFWQKQVNLRAGDDLGRIYRISSTLRPARKWQKLSELTSAQLVDQLASLNGWHRDTAQQLLLWRNDQSVVERLTELIVSPQPDQHPATAVHALYVLDSFGKLSDNVLAMAIRELDAKVAIHGLRIAESQLSKNTVLQNALVYRSQQLLENNDDVATADHLADSLLGMQIAYSAGYLHREMAASVLVSLSGVSRSDYLQTAVLSSVSADNIGAVVDRAVDESRVELLAQLLPMAVRMQQPEAVVRGVSRLKHLQESLQSRLQVAANVLRAMQDAQWNDSDTDPVTKMLDPLFVHANNLVADSAEEDAIRVAAAELIAEWARPDSPELQKLVATAMPLEVQKVGLRRLLTSTQAETIEMIWDQWRSHSPALKDVILDQLLSRKDSTELLLNAVETQKLDGNQIGPRHRQKLQLYPDDDVRERANRLLQRQGDSDRKTLVARYIQAMPEVANLDQGRQLFQKHCATCHQLGGEGFSVGPDLTALTDKSVAALTTAILDPNNAVEDRFLNYVAVLNNGSQVSGMVVAEAGNGITLRSADGKTTTVFRNELEELIASGASYMPEGFEQQLQPDQVADIIHFVQQQKGVRKEFVGNQPQVAPVRDDGSIRLFAIHAEIYGPNLVFETQYRNLGYWANEADRAVWQLDVPKAGKYRVYFDAACPDDVAGNHVALTIGDNTLVGQMKSTGGWDSYDWVSMGTIELASGKCQGTVQAAGPIHHFLMDLRTVILEPVSP